MKPAAPEKATPEAEADKPSHRGWKITAVIILLVVSGAVIRSLFDKGFTRSVEDARSWIERIDG